MAKITGFTPKPRKENPYVGEVEQLKALGVPTPEGEAWGVENVARDGVDKVRIKFGEAARKAGFTARFRGTQDGADGTVTVIFTARELDAPRERGKGEKVTETKEAPKPGK